MVNKLRDRFIEGLKAKGENEVKRGRTWIAYTRKEGGYWYLGNHGSLRFGLRKIGSIPASHSVREALLMEDK
jgi:hypothetical protein